MTDDNPYIGKIQELLIERNVTNTTEMDNFFKLYGGIDYPAALKHHSNCRWGWWKHNYEGLRIAFQLNDEYGLGYSYYSIAKTWLGHDLDKAVRGCQARLLKSGEVSNDKNKGPLEYNGMPFDLGHEVTSLVEACKVFALDNMEKQAILHHMGPFSWDFEWEKVNDKVGKFTMFIHIVDMIVSHIVEKTYDLMEEPREYAEILKTRIGSE